MPQDKTNLQTIVDGIGNAGGQSGAQTNEALKVLTDRLTKQGKGIASSSTSNITGLINNAISSTQKAGNLSSAALESKRQRELGFAKDQASSQITTALEQSSGYARQISGLKDLTQTTEKSIRDLNDRYQEAIRLNDSATATRVANLQMKKLEFQQSAEESFYKNLLSVSALSESVAARKQRQTQFEDKIKFDQAMFESRSSQQEKQKGLDLAAKYGVKVSPTDTFSDIVNKVAPHVTRQEALQLKVLESQVNKNNASAAKALRGEAGSNLSDTDIEALATAYANGNQDVVGFIADGAIMAKVLSRASSLESERSKNLNILARSVTSKQELINLVSQSNTVDATQAEIDSMAVIYGSDWLKRETKKGGQSPFGKNVNLTNKEKIKLDKLRGVTISQG